MNHIMIDLETLGQSADAAIVSIGAVRFNIGGVDDEFYEVVDLASNLRAGRRIDADTLIWWMKQSENAREVFNQLSFDLPVCLRSLTQFLPRDCAVWGNGADFDNAILAHAYRSVDVEIPWRFWNNRCYRTVKNLFKTVEMQRSGTHHNALDDARSQAEHLIEIAKRGYITL